MTRSLGPPLLDPRAQAAADRLHRRGSREVPGMVAHFVLREVTSRLRGRRFIAPDADDMIYLRDKLIPLDRAKCELCYLLCRSLGARRVVEIGTSFGVSTIYLAAAVRDGGGGTVVGTEIDSCKVELARANLAEAGLEGFAEVREGDALDSLKDPGGAADFVLIDTWIPVARPAIELLTPHLRPGALVACDNTRSFRKQYRDYLDYVYDPANGFRSLTAPYKGGIELSVRVSGTR